MSFQSKASSDPRTGIVSLAITTPSFASFINILWKNQAATLSSFQRKVQYMFHLFDLRFASNFVHAFFKKSHIPLLKALPESVADKITLRHTWFSTVLHFVGSERD